MRRKRIRVADVPMQFDAYMQMKQSTDDIYMFVRFCSVSLLYVTLHRVYIVCLYLWHCSQLIVCLTRVNY